MMRFSGFRPLVQSHARETHRNNTLLDVVQRRSLSVLDSSKLWPSSPCTVSNKGGRKRFERLGISEESQGNWMGCRTQFARSTSTALSTMSRDVRKAGISTTATEVAQFPVFPTAMATTYTPRENTLSVLAFLMLKQRKQDVAGSDIKGHRRKVICSNLRSGNLTAVEEGALVKAAVANIQEWAIDPYYSAIIQEIIRSGKPDSKRRLTTAVLDKANDINSNIHGGRVLRTLVKFSGNTSEFLVVLRKHFSNWSRKYGGVLILKELLDQPFDEEHKILSQLILNDITEIAPHRFGKWLVVSALERVNTEDKLELLLAVIPYMELCYELPQGLSYTGIVIGEIGDFYPKASASQQEELVNALISQVNESGAQWLLQHPDAALSSAVLTGIIKSPNTWKHPSLHGHIAGQIINSVDKETRSFVVDKFAENSQTWATTKAGANAIIRFFENTTAEEAEPIIAALSSMNPPLVSNPHGSRVALFLLRRGSKAQAQPIVNSLFANIVEYSQESQTAELVKFAVRLAEKEQIANALDELRPNLLNVCKSPLLQPVLQELHKHCDGKDLRELNNEILQIATDIKNHPIGHKIIRQVLHRGSLELKESLLEAFIPSLRELSMDEHGFEVCKLCVAVAYELDKALKKKSNAPVFLARVRESLDPIDTLLEDKYGGVVARFMQNHVERHVNEVSLEETSLNARAG